MGAKLEAHVLQQVGAALRSARKRAGLSQEKLALKAGVDRTYVGGIERGERNPSILNLARLADALEISLSALLASVNSKKAP